MNNGEDLKEILAKIERIPERLEKVSRPPSNLPKILIEAAGLIVLLLAGVIAVHMKIAQIEGLHLNNKQRLEGFELRINRAEKAFSETMRSHRQSKWHEGAGEEFMRIREEMGKLKK